MINLARGSADSTDIEQNDTPWNISIPRWCAIHSASACFVSSLDTKQAETWLLWITVWAGFSDGPWGLSSPSEIPSIYTWHWKRTPPSKTLSWQFVAKLLHKSQLVRKRHLWMCSGVKIWEKHEMAAEVLHECHKRGHFELKDMSFVRQESPSASFHTWSECGSTLSTLSTLSYKLFMFVFFIWHYNLYIKSIVDIKSLQNPLLKLQLLSDVNNSSK